jgi:hypothetical protein
MGRNAGQHADPGRRTMQRSGYLAIILSLALAFLALACGPKGATPEDKRDFVRNMRTNTLNKLYKIRPDARRNLQRGVGYAVFSNVESKFFVVGGGSGYGVVVDNATGQETFMRMARIHGGFGMGLVDFRAWPSRPRPLERSTGRTRSSTERRGRGSSFRSTDGRWSTVGYG